jgi:hypothetical protein
VPEAKVVDVVCCRLSFRKAIRAGGFRQARALNPSRGEDYPVASTRSVTNWSTGFVGGPGEKC